MCLCNGFTVGTTCFPSQRLQFVPSYLSLDLWMTLRHVVSQNTSMFKVIIVIIIRFISHLLLGTFALVRGLSYRPLDRLTEPLPLANGLKYR